MSLNAWIDETRKALWTQPNDIKANYATASFLSGNRVVFNIKGNKYRLLTQVNYEYGYITILRIGTRGVQQMEAVKEQETADSRLLTVDSKPDSGQPSAANSQQSFKPVYALIKTKAEYDELLQELIDLLALSPPRDTPASDRLELLSLLVQDYDAKHFQFDTPDPIDAILFRMDQMGLKRKDLIPYLGSRHKVSEVLNRKRPLSLAMMRALHEGLGIPLEVLIQAPRMNP
jgi:antitoxin component HigA of HigAB toxin-antitoxin module/mRNA-degrading endonuclease HigB of HigAB toxin-antitoxin module